MKILTILALVMLICAGAAIADTINLEDAFGTYENCNQPGEVCKSAASGGECMCGNSIIGDKQFCCVMGNRALPYNSKDECDKECLSCEIMIGGKPTSILAGDSVCVQEGQDYYQYSCTRDEKGILTPMSQKCVGECKGKQCATQGTFYQDGMWLFWTKTDKKGKISGDPSRVIFTDAADVLEVHIKPNAEQIEGAAGFRQVQPGDFVITSTLEGIKVDSPLAEEGDNTFMARYKYAGEFGRMKVGDLVISFKGFTRKIPLGAGEGTACSDIQLSNFYSRQCVPTYSNKGMPSSRDCVDGSLIESGEFKLDCAPDEVCCEVKAICEHMMDGGKCLDKKYCGDKWNDFGCGDGKVCCVPSCNELNDAVRSMLKESLGVAKEDDIQGGKTFADLTPDQIKNYARQVCVDGDGCCPLGCQSDPFTYESGDYMGTTINEVADDDCNAYAAGVGAIAIFDWVSRMTGGKTVMEYWMSLVNNLLYYVGYINPDSWKESICNWVTGFSKNEGMLMLPSSDPALLYESYASWGMERQQLTNGSYIYSVVWAIGGLEFDVNYMMMLEPGDVALIEPVDGNPWISLPAGNIDQPPETGRAFWSPNRYDRICLVLEDEVYTGSFEGWDIFSGLETFRNRFCRDAAPIASDSDPAFIPSSGGSSSGETTSGDHTLGERGVGDGV